MMKKKTKKKKRRTKKIKKKSKKVFYKKIKLKPLKNSDKVKDTDKVLVKIKSDWKKKSFD